MLEEARKHPIVYDEDSPKMTPKMREALKVAVRERNRRNAEKRNAI